MEPGPIGRWQWRRRCVPSLLTVDVDVEIVAETASATARPACSAATPTAAHGRHGAVARHVTGLAAFETVKIASTGAATSATTATGAIGAATATTAIIARRVAAAVAEAAATAATTTAASRHEWRGEGKRDEEQRSGVGIEIGSTVAVEWSECDRVQSSRRECTCCACECECSSLCWLQSGHKCSGG